MKRTNWKKDLNAKLLDHTELASQLISTPRAVQQGYDTNAARASLAAYILRLGDGGSSGSYLDMLEVADHAMQRGWISETTFNRIADLVEEYA